ncbi:unnamed protein product, partial [Rotaria magnacalcarata]
MVTRNWLFDIHWQRSNCYYLLGHCTRCAFYGAKVPDDALIEPMTAITVLRVYSTLSNYLLRWLGADIEDDVKLAELQPFLYFPSNILKLNHGVTTFSALMQQILETIVVTILPGTKLCDNKVIGSLALINNNTKYFDTSKVLLSILGRSVSFAIANDAFYSDDSLSLEPPCIFGLFTA